MASFFGEVVTGSCRYFDDEDDEEVLRTFSLSTTNLSAEPKLLILAEGKLPAVYMKLCTKTQEVASVVGAFEGKSTKVGSIYRGSNWTVVTCEGDLKMGEYTPLATLLLTTLVEPSTNILCLTARHISEYRGDWEEDNVVRCLTTHQFPTQTAIKRLEVPNLLTGLSAALVSLAAVKGLPAALVVNYVEVMDADSLSLSGFDAIHKLTGVNQAGLTRQNNIAHALKSLNQFANPSNLYM